MKFILFLLENLKESVKAVGGLLADSDQRMAICWLTLDYLLHSAKKLTDN